jgi:hypothetical protein
MLFGSKSSVVDERVGEKADGWKAGEEKEWSSVIKKISFQSKKSMDSYRCSWLDFLGLV